MLSDVELIRAVQEMAGTAYVIYGELGRSADRDVALLARDNETRSLVVLMITPERQPDGSIQLAVDERTSLDSRVPAADAFCPSCRTKLRPWARFCGECSLDLSGRTVESSGDLTQLRHAVQLAIGLDHEFLGDMLRTEGGGPVFFVRDRATQSVTALSLKRDLATGEVQMGETQVMPKMRRSMDATAFNVVQQVPQMDRAGGYAPLAAPVEQRSPPARPQPPRSPPARRPDPTRIDLLTPYGYQQQALAPAPDVLEAAPGAVSDVSWFRRVPEPVLAAVAVVTVLGLLLWAALAL